jgi:hypothetical protein
MLPPVPSKSSVTLLPDWSTSPERPATSPASNGSSNERDEDSTDSPPSYPPRLVERIWAARIAAPDLVRSAHEYAHELDATVDLNDRKGEYETRRDPVRAGLSS